MNLELPELRCDGRSTQSRGVGFTLVELLVSIGIIGILLSVLLPSLSRARESANAAVCLNNMRQIVLGIFQYAQNNGGQLPAGGSNEYEAIDGSYAKSSFDWIAWHAQHDPISGMLNPNVVDPASVTLPSFSSTQVYAQSLSDSAIAPFLSSQSDMLASVLRCPSDNLWDRPATDPTGKGAYRYSYSINIYVTLVYASSYDEATGRKLPPTQFAALEQQ